MPAGFALRLPSPPAPPEAVTPEEKARRTVAARRHAEAEEEAEEEAGREASERPFSLRKPVSVPVRSPNPLVRDPFEELDANGDGIIDRYEYEAWVARKMSSRSAFTSRQQTPPPPKPPGAAWVADLPWFSPLLGQEASLPLPHSHRILPSPSGLGESKGIQIVRSLFPAVPSPMLAQKTAYRTAADRRPPTPPSNHTGSNVFREERAPPAANRVQCAALAYALATAWRLEECAWKESLHAAFGHWLDITWSKQPIGFHLTQRDDGDESRHNGYGAAAYHDATAESPGPAGAARALTASLLASPPLQALETRVEAEPLQAQDPAPLPSARGEGPPFSLVVVHPETGERIPLELPRDAPLFPALCEVYYSFDDTASVLLASGVPTEVYGWDHNRQDPTGELHYPSAIQCGFREGQLLHLAAHRRGDLPDPRADPGACIKCNPLPSPMVVAAALAVLSMAPLGRIDLSALVAYTVLIRNSGMVSSGLAVPLMQLVSRGDTQGVWMHLLHCVAQCSGRELACRCCLGLYGTVEQGEQREYVAFLRKYLDHGDMALRLASDFKDGPSRASAAEAVRDAGYVEAYHRLMATCEEPRR